LPAQHALRWLSIHASWVKPHAEGLTSAVLADPWRSLPAWNQPAGSIHGQAG
jgi:hypothetical protein